jgi:hypothetical protein
MIILAVPSMALGGVIGYLIDPKLWPLFVPSIRLSLPGAFLVNGFAEWSLRQLGTAGEG